MVARFVHTEEVTGSNPVSPTSLIAFFWPIFPMLAWGIGVVMNAWDVWRGDFSEEQIAEEMQRLERRRV